MAVTWLFLIMVEVTVCPWCHHEPC